MEIQIWTNEMQLCLLAAYINPKPISIRDLVIAHRTCACRRYTSSLFPDREHLKNSSECAHLSTGHYSLRLQRCALNVLMHTLHFIASKLSSRKICFQMATVNNGNIRLTPLNEESRAVIVTARTSSEIDGSTTADQFKNSSTSQDLKNCSFWRSIRQSFASFSR